MPDTKHVACQFRVDIKDCHETAAGINLQTIVNFQRKRGFRAMELIGARDVFLIYTQRLKKMQALRGILFDLSNAYESHSYWRFFRRFAQMMCTLLL